MTLPLLTVEQTYSLIMVVHLPRRGTSRRLRYVRSDRASVTQIEFLRYSYDKRGRFNDIAISCVQTHGDEQLVNSPSLSIYLVKDRAFQSSSSGTNDARMWSSEKEIDTRIAMKSRLDISVAGSRT